MMNRSPARKKSFGSLSGAKVSRRGSRGMMSNMDSHLRLGGVLDVGNGKGRLDCGKHGVRDRAKLRIAKPDAIGTANRMHDRCVIAIAKHPCDLGIAVWQCVARHPDDRESRLDKECRAIGRASGRERVGPYE